jgi:hypothetical protein
VEKRGWKECAVIDLIICFITAMGFVIPKTVCRANLNTSMNVVERRDNIKMRRR